MKKFLPLCLILIVAVFACKKDNNDPTKYQKVTSYMQEKGNFNNYLYALNKTKANELINEMAETVLAPNDEAFEKYFTENGYASIEEVPIEELDKIVRLGIIQKPMFQNEDAGYYQTMYKSPAPANQKSVISNVDPEVFLFAQFNRIVEGGTQYPYPASVMSTVITDMLNLNSPFFFEMQSILNVPTIYDLIKHNDDLEYFLHALDFENPDLPVGNLLKNEDNLTVFASDNNFVSWYFTQTLNVSDPANLFPFYYKNVEEFLYHQIKTDGDVRLIDNSPGVVTTMSSLFVVNSAGSSITFRLRNDQLTLEQFGTSNLITVYADVVASNGYLNIIKFNGNFNGF